MRQSFRLSLFLISLLSACTAQTNSINISPSSSNASIILERDIAQNALAQESGVYKALLETAADNAILFIPEPTDAKKWLGAQKPLTNTKWQPHAVYASCDGKTGVVTGNIQWGEANGYYTTIWQYFESASGQGAWRWIVSHGDKVEFPKKAPKTILSRTASCEGKAPVALQAPNIGVQMKQGLAYDQSLSWRWQYRGDKSHQLVVKIWDGKKNITVLTNEIEG